MTRRLILLLWLTVLVFSGCAFNDIRLFHSVQPLKEKVLKGKGEAKILMINVESLISEKKKSKGLGFAQRPSMVERIKEELEKAEEDSSIAAVIVKVNSPGGTVTASDILYHELMEFKKRTRVRVVASFTSTATSGGYYVASASDEIVAHPTSVTGSIGVLAMKFNIEALLSKIGVEQETIKSGGKKDIWSPFRPSTPEERRVLQEIIDELYHRFVDVVTDGRKSLSRDDVVKLADGRIFTAEQALQNGLIDRVEYLEDTIEKTKKDLGLKEAKIIAYCRPGGYRGSLYSRSSSFPVNINLLSLSVNDLASFSGIEFMYLWRP